MATQYTWTGPGARGPASGEWSAPGNWTPAGGPPRADDSVVLGGTGSYAVKLDVTTPILSAVLISNPAAKLDLSGSILNAGSISNSGTISGGGSVVAAIGGTGTVTTNGATLELDGDINGAGTFIVDTGIMLVNGSVNATGGTTLFELGAGTLTFGDVTVSAATIHPITGPEGSAATGVLDLTAMSSANLQAFGTNALLENMTGFDGIKIDGAVSANYSSGVLDVFNNKGSLLVALHFFGTLPADNTPFYMSGNDAVFCFMAGTAIATPDGTCAIENLATGDMVMTNDGRAAPVRWVGRQTVSAFFANPLRTLPIRIKAGALGDNLPVRDLLLSPGHALMLDGILVLAGVLVNGSSIVRETSVPATFTYYHVELADHALLLAEGVPAETFVDNVDRVSADNWAEHEALYPEGAPMTEMDLPLAKSYRQVPASLRQRVADRAATLSGPGALAA